MEPVAYIRKSKVNPNGHGLSWEVQEAQVRELAERHGDGPALTILSDWGSSGAAAAGPGVLGGTGRGGKRKVWAHLVEMIDARQVSALYAYSLSRLARSTRELLDLAERCASAGVVVRLAKEGTLDFNSAHGRLYLTVLAAVATFEAEVSAERARDHVRQRRANGDHIGQPPYGFRLVRGKLEPDPERPIEPVLAAYAEAGTFHGAARLLNARNQPSRSGARWSDMTVRAVVARVNGEVRPVKPGRPAATPALLSKLLRCHCGGPMTPSRDHARLADGTKVVYQHYICWRSRHEADHPRPSKVTEAALLPWIRDEADRLLPPDAIEAPDLPHGSTETREDLMDRRQRALYQHQRRYIGDEELDALMGEIDDALEALEATAWVVQIVPPAIDWTWPPDQINAVLRALWDHVQLDEQLRPLSAEWTVPEWRA